MLNEIRHMGGVHHGDVQDCSYLASAVLRLMLNSEFGRTRRLIDVAKHAGSDHSKQIGRRP